MAQKTGKMESEIIVLFACVVFGVLLPVDSRPGPTKRLLCFKAATDHL